MITHQTTPPATEEPRELPSHVLHRGVVFEDLRVMYVPVPKASCTAILWSLARCSGVEDEVFLRSLGREVTRPLTIHDMSRWPDELRFGKRSEADRENILRDETWLRFTVVRHPFRRLWSAWQSKILLSEPQFAEKFSAEPWYPKAVGSSAEMVAMFHRFLDAFEDDPALAESDVHWAPQSGLIEMEDVPYDHIGRVEQLFDTLNLLRDHVREVKGAELPELPRTNVTALRYADELFDERHVRNLTEPFGRDLQEFGYEPPPEGAWDAPCPAEWMAAADSVAPALEEIRHRNERIADLQSLSSKRRAELRARIAEQRSRIGDQRRRLKLQTKLRAEEQRRNERLQNRLREATVRVERIEKSLSWRVTRPLRAVAAAARRLRRKLLGG